VCESIETRELENGLYSKQQKQEKQTSTVPAARRKERDPGLGAGDDESCDGGGGSVRERGGDKCCERRAKGDVAPLAVVEQRDPHEVAQGLEDRRRQPAARRVTHMGADRAEQCDNLGEIFAEQPVAEQERAGPRGGPVPVGDGRASFAGRS
jgi:hypothetical protein